MDATTVAVDLATDVFEVALANRAGRILERKRLTRRQFERFIDSLPAALRSSWKPAAPPTTGDGVVKCVHSRCRCCRRSTFDRM